MSYRPTINDRSRWRRTLEMVIIKDGLNCLNRIAFQAVIYVDGSRNVQLLCALHEVPKRLAREGFSSLTLSYGLNISRAS